MVPTGLLAASAAMAEVSDVASTSTRVMDTIWRGVLEWTDQTESSTSEVTCWGSVIHKGGETQVAYRMADTWPLKLTMQLMPKKLIGNDQGLRDCKCVVFHFFSIDSFSNEAVESLHRFLISNSVGIVRFGDESGEKVMILVFKHRNKTVFGYIPDDQAAFLDRLRNAIQHQKTLPATNPQSQMPEWVPSPGSLLGRLVSNVGQQQKTSVDGGEAGPSAQPSTSQGDNQIKMQKEQSFRMGDEQLDKLVEKLDCPVCLMFLDRELVECVNGHYICRGCKRGCDKCPICRKSFSNVKRNTLMQQLLELIPHRCRYEDCSYFVGSCDDHERFCIWRPTSCKMCEWSGSVAQLEDHVGNVHAALVNVRKRVDICRRIELGPEDRNPNDDRLFIFGNYLWVRYENNANLNSFIFYFNPVMIKKPLDLWVKLSLGSENNGTNFIRKIIVHDYQATTLSVPLAVYRDYLTNNTLSYQLAVSETKFSN